VTERDDTVAWREGKGVCEADLLAAMGPGLARSSTEEVVPAARFSEVIAAIAARLVRALAAAPSGMAEHEIEMLIHAIAAMVIGGEHDEERKIAAFVAQANLGIVSRIGTARTFAVEGALGWFPRALEWATRRARLDRKCPHNLAHLAAEAVSHHIAIARALGRDPDAAERAELEAQREDVQAVLSGQAVAFGSQ
jgi:hypothetical protein